MLQVTCTEALSAHAFARPGAPFERKYLAIEVLNALLAAFPPGDPPGQGTGRGRGGGAQPRVACPLPFSPLHPGFLSPEVTQLFLANAIDSWDKLRQVGEWRRGVGMYAGCSGYSTGTTRDSAQVTDGWLLMHNHKA